MWDATKESEGWTCDMGDADGGCSVCDEVCEDASEGGMYVEVKYFVFESFVPYFVKSLGDVTKDYVCVVFVLLGVGYGFMEEGEGGVRPSTSPESVLVVVVEVM